jgi:hypothetical protein
MTPNTFEITNHDNGIKFLVRLVYSGQTYGRDFCLTHNEADPLVEFYDTRFPHTEFGQFVSRYYLSTLLEDRPFGLTLDGGVANWYLPIASMCLVMQWLDAKAQEMNL